MKNLTIIFCIAIALAILGGCLSAINNDNAWNNGKCDCGGAWHLFDIEKSHKTNSTYYYYKCEHCENIIQLSQLYS